MRQCCLGHVEIAVNIGTQGFIEVFFGDVFKRFGMFLKRRVVHQNVELAEFSHGFFHHLAAQRRILHIAGHQQATPAFGFDAALCLFGIDMLIEVKNGHISAFSGKQHRHCPANARVATSDQCSQAFKLAASFVAFGHELGRQLHVGFESRFLQVLCGHRRCGLVNFAGLNWLLFGRFIAGCLGFLAVLVVLLLLDLALGGDDRIAAVLRRGARWGLCHKSLLKNQNLNLWP